MTSEQRPSVRGLRVGSAAIVAVALAGSSAGSGGNASSGSAKSTSAASAATSTPTTTSTPALEPAVRAYVSALLGGDGSTAFRLLSDRCQRQEGATTFALVAAQAHEQFGSATIMSCRDDVTGLSASATYTMSDPGLNGNGPQPWVLEGGQWKMDRCP
jgi:hypothetical protein